MFQRAHAKRHDVARAHAHDIQPAHHSSVGKRTITENLAPKQLGAADFYGHTVETVRRELYAVRRTALPAYIEALRRQNDIEMLKVALQVRHMLMTANQRVQALEKAMTHVDPMVLHLRRDLDTLATRAFRLGVYRGCEDLRPRVYEELIKPKASMLRIKNPPATTDHKPALSKPSATAVAKVTRKLPPAPPPPPPTARRTRVRLDVPGGAR